MTASRQPLFASALLAARCLLAVVFLPGCAVYREYVRRGELLDSLAIRLARLERMQGEQAEEIKRLRADALTGLENIDRRIDEVGSEVQDLGERVDRIGRRVGAWRGEIEVAPSGGGEGGDAGTQRVEQPVSSGQSPASERAQEKKGAEEQKVNVVDADQIYNLAYLDFTRGNYGVAVTGFRRFIKLFPASELADNAQYWIGECFYSLNQLDSAEVEFKKVMSDYPEGNKVPAAIYKLGMVYLLQGKTALAQEKFKEVVRNYPTSPEAKLAQERLLPQDRGR